MTNFIEIKSLHPFYIIEIYPGFVAVHHGLVIDMRTGEKIDVEGTYDLRYKIPERLLDLSGGQKVFLRIIHGASDSVEANKSVAATEAFVYASPEPVSSSSSSDIEVGFLNGSSVDQKLKSDYYISVLGTA